MRTLISRPVPLSWTSEGTHRLGSAAKIGEIISLIAEEAVTVQRDHDRRHLCLISTPVGT
jgi:hypothetical protein